MRNNVITPVWEYGERIDRLLDPITNTEIGSIFTVDIGLVDVVSRWCVSIDAGDHVVQSFHKAISQESGREYSYRDVVRDRRGAHILADSFVAQRYVWRMQ